MKKYSVTQDALKKWSERFNADRSLRIAAMALSKSEINQAACVAAQADLNRYHFSVEIPTLPVADQAHSGRCWLFAAANVLREKIANDLGLKEFELSQSYLAFWDKLERANYFMGSIVDTAELPVSDRTVAFILSTGVHDGGQWAMFANIVRKYGIVPKDAFDETFQSSNTRQMNYYLNRYLKACAVRLRGMVRAGAGEEEIRSAREGMMDRVYAFLCACYGEPPKQFDFVYTDKDGVYHNDPGLTPLTFRDKYIGSFTDDMVSVINAPTGDKAYGKTYTIRYLGNVEEEDTVKHLNLTMAEIREAVIAQLRDGQVVWFGSDVGHWGDREKGYWDDKAFDVSLLTGLELDISKEDALDYQFSAMNHAMVLTGVELKDGRPVRWKIENSWGDEKGKKGYYICSDTWFEQYVYQAAIQRKYLKGAERFDQAPAELDPWDPMGTLAE